MRCPFLPAGAGKLFEVLDLEVLGGAISAPLNWWHLEQVSDVVARLDEPVASHQCDEAFICSKCDDSIFIRR